MKDFEARYDKGETKKFAVILALAGIVSLGLGFLSYFVISKNLYAFIIFLLLGCGVMGTAIAFFIKTTAHNVAFFAKSDSLNIRGIVFKKNQILQVDGVLNLGRENSKAYLDELAVSAPQERFFGDVYIMVKGKQYKFSYVQNIMGCFEYFAAEGIKNTLVIWTGQSNRKYTYFDIEEVEEEKKETEE